MSTIEFYDKFAALASTVTLTSEFQHITLFGEVTFASALTSASGVEYIAYYLDEETIADSGVMVPGVALDLEGLSASWIDVRLVAATLPLPTPMPETFDPVTDLPNLSVRWLTDREKWSKEHLVNLGFQGDAYPTARFKRMGMYHTRQYELVASSPVVALIVAVEEEAELLR